ncbi:hypothetical protein B0H19DRAFT_1258001 [Mycena capillaripes]|nr:hypothetical protein B0H19DRAFT_1258001 [Mycena capillaripes]
MRREEDAGVVAECGECGEAQLSPTSQYGKRGVGGLSKKEELPQDVGQLALPLRVRGVRSRDGAGETKQKEALAAPSPLHISQAREGFPPPQTLHLRPQPKERAFCPPPCALLPSPPPNDWWTTPCAIIIPNPRIDPPNPKRALIRGPHEIDEDPWPRRTSARHLAAPHLQPRRETQDWDMLHRSVFSSIKGSSVGVSALFARLYADGTLDAGPGSGAAKERRMLR